MGRQRKGPPNRTRTNTSTPQSRANKGYAKYKKRRLKPGELEETGVGKGLVNIFRRGVRNPLKASPSQTAKNYNPKQGANNSQYPTSNVKVVKPKKKAPAKKKIDPRRKAKEYPPVPRGQKGSPLKPVKKRVPPKRNPDRVRDKEYPPRAPYPKKKVPPKPLPAKKVPVKKKAPVKKDGPPRRRSPMTPEDVARTIKKLGYKPSRTGLEGAYKRYYAKGLSPRRPIN